VVAVAGVAAEAGEGMEEAAAEGRGRWWGGGGGGGVEEAAEEAEAEEAEGIFRHRGVATAAGCSTERKRPTVGLYGYKSNPVDPQLESAWFQPLNL
jgi:hypothetical protein